MKVNASDITNELVNLVRERKLIILAGAGISYESGLPLWDELIDEFIDFCERLQPHLDDSKKFQSLLDDAKKDENKRYPARIASALKDELERIDEGTGQIKLFFDTWLTDVLTGRDLSMKKRRGKSFPTNAGEPNEYHHTIVKTDYPFILTSNYDTLLERAAKEHFGMSTPSYTYKHPSHIATSIYERKRAIVHIHGVVNDVNIGDFVFTEDDYSKIKRIHPGFRLSLETLFIRYCTLFVGYGGSDPHLEDISEELSVHLWQDAHNSVGYATNFPKSYLILPENRADKLMTKYKSKFRTDIIAINNFNESLDLLKTLQNECPRK